MKKIISVVCVVGASCMPAVAFAATVGVKALILSTGRLINMLLGVIASLALLFFLWGLAKFVMHVGGDEKAIEEGRSFMKWGLIGLFVMISIWGIVNFLVSASGLGSVGPTHLPGQGLDPTNGPSPIGPGQSPIAPFVAPN